MDTFSSLILAPAPFVVSVLSLFAVFLICIFSLSGKRKNDV